jgi:hypothetical protein
MHDLAPWYASAELSTTATSGLDNVKTVVDILQALITSAAVVIGGIWAYFKFAQGRTFRPRIEVAMSGQWRDVGESKLLHARIRVKNIGLSRITLIQKGTGLRVSLMAENQSASPARSSWLDGKVYKILDKHAWIEPGETVSDELLLNLGVSKFQPTMLEARLVWYRRRSNITVFAKEIISADAVMTEPSSGG